MEKYGKYLVNLSVFVFANRYLYAFLNELRDDYFTPKIKIYYIESILVAQEDVMFISSAARLQITGIIS